MSSILTTVRCVCNEIWKTMRGDGSHHESCLHHRRRANSMESRRKSRPARPHRSAERTPTTASSLTHESDAAPSRHGKQHSCRASSRSAKSHHATSSSHNQHTPSGHNQHTPSGHNQHTPSGHRQSRHEAARCTYQACPQSAEPLYKGRIPGETERHYETPDHIYDTPDNVLCAMESRRDLVPAIGHGHSRVAARRSDPGAGGDAPRGKHNLQSDIGTLCSDIEQQLSALEKSLESEFRFYRQYIRDTKSLLTTRAANIGNKALLYDDYSNNEDDS
ncbi:NF-kappaB inhibitor [Bovine papular stomatitis virus]